MELVASVQSLGGAARTADLLALGYRRREFTSAVASGRITRVSRGVYAIPGVDRSQLLATLFGAQITCVSSLAHHGVALLHRPERVHLHVPSSFNGHGRSLEGVQLHSGSNRDASGFAPVLEALAVASRCLSAREHLIALDSALHRGLVRTEDLMQWRSAMSADSCEGRMGAERSGGPPSDGQRQGAATDGDSRVPQHSIRFPRGRRDWLVGRCDGRADSPLETLARLELSEAGLEVHPQYFIDGVGRVDLLVEGRLVVELDGKEHHDDPRAFQRDRERDRKLKHRGYLVVRYTYADLMGARALDIAADVRAILAARALRRQSR